MGFAGSFLSAPRCLWTYQLLNPRSDRQIRSTLSPLLLHLLPVCGGDVVRFAVALTHTRFWIGCLPLFWSNVQSAHEGRLSDGLGRLHASPPYPHKTYVATSNRRCGTYRSMSGARADVTKHVLRSWAVVVVGLGRRADDSRRRVLADSNLPPPILSQPGSAFPDATTVDACVAGRASCMSRGNPTVRKSFPFIFLFLSSSFCGTHKKKKRDGEGWDQPEPPHVSGSGGAVEGRRGGCGAWNSRSRAGRLLVLLGVGCGQMYYYMTSTQTS
ncbi:hypothetical protein BHE74_00047817 [Ensete ventricosum]|nr:hypothetical protein BHE74_00047817 [Ensete ventricosum]